MNSAQVKKGFREAEAQDLLKAGFDYITEKNGITEPLW